MIVLSNPFFIYVQSNIAGAFTTHAVYADWNGQISTFGRESHTIADGSGTVLVVSSPPVGMQRSIKYFGVRLGSTIGVYTVYWFQTSIAVLFYGSGTAGTGYSYTEGKGWQFLSGLGGVRRAWVV